jgi:environmental stress-induced protein Ves
MIRARLALSIFVVSICTVGFAQDVRSGSTVGVSADGVRFLSSGPIVAMRVEVLSPGGTALYDSDWKSGNVLDWMTPVVPYGAYSVRLLTKDLEGRVSEKQATLHVAPDGMSIDPAAASDLKMTITLHDGQTGQLVTTSGDLSFRFGDFLNRKDTEAMRLTAGGELQVKGLIRTGEGIMFPDGSVQRSAAMPSIVRMQPVSGDPQRDGLQPRSNTTGMGTTNQVTKWLDAVGTLGDSAISESGGAVKIGTNAAQGQLQIAGAANQDIFSGMGPNIVAGPAFNYGYAGLTFGVGAGFFNVRPAAGATGVNPSLRFMTINQERMIVTNDGNVGIGTSAPEQKLEVAGNLKLSGTGLLVFSDGSSMSTAGATLGPNTFTGDQTVLANLSANNVTTGIVTAATVNGTNVHANSDVTAAGNVVATGVVAGATGSFSGDIVTFGGAVDAFTQFNINGKRMLSNAGTNNVFVGVNAGLANTTGQGLVFAGKNAGQANTSGLSGTFVGYQAGTNNTTAGGNSFFGAQAGASNTTGASNSFFGSSAGQGSTLGAYNSFFGALAGSSNGPGGSNSAFGYGAGAYAAANDNSYFGYIAGIGSPDSNTAARNAFFGSSSGQSISTGSNNAFFGKSSGQNVTTGANNVLVGYSSGLAVTSENAQTLIGSQTNGASAVTNATAIGANASVTQSNSLVLGSINTVNGATASTNVGIGTTAPNATLHVAGGDAAITTQGNGVILRATDGANCYRVTVNDLGILGTAVVACP